MPDTGEHSISVNCFHCFYPSLFLGLITLLPTPKPSRLPRYPSLHLPSCSVSHQVQYFPEIADSFVLLAHASVTSSPPIIIKDCSPLSPALPQSVLFSATRLILTAGTQTFPSCTLKHSTALHHDTLIFILYRLVSLSSVQLLPTFLAIDTLLLLCIQPVNSWHRLSLRDSFFFCFFLGLFPRHMEVLRLGVEMKVQLPAYTTAMESKLHLRPTPHLTATLDP